MAGSAIISVVEPTTLQRAGSICEDSGNDICAKVAVHLFNHIAMGFHSESVTQLYHGFAFFIAAEMDVSFAVTFMPFQNSLEIL